MRICHVITRMIIGGAQENTLLTCVGLRDRGHDVVLVAGPETGPEGSLWPQVEAAGLRHIVVPDLRRAASPWRDGRCLRRLRSLFRELGCQVVHTHSSKAGILGRLAARPRSGRPPSRLPVDQEFTDGGSSPPAPIVVHTIHGMSFNRTQPAAVRTLYRVLERRAARVTDAFVSVADAMTDQAVAAGLAPRERFVTIHSGMQTERFAPDPAARARVRREWGVPDEAVVVGTIARLFRNKGYEQILEAMPGMVRPCPDLHFVWVGDGRDRPAYEQRLIQSGLRDRVHLTGLVPPETIPSLLCGFDIVLHASQWEGLARALPQALLTEVPVVSFDNDGAPEVVIPDVTGALVPLGDTAGLATGVTRLASSPELRRRLGVEGRRRCLDLFDHRRMVEQIEALYRRLAPA